MRIIYKNTPIILMLLVYLFLGSIYPARRFNFHYAILFKIFYLGICVLGVCQLVRQRFSQRLFPWGMALFGCVAGISALTSFYPVRAGSELDIMMATIALSFLFWTHGSLQPLERLKFLGIAILCLLHFSICLTLACEIYHFPFSYPWVGVARDFLLNITSIFQFFVLEKACCPFDYVNYAGYFGVLAFPFFLGLLLAEQKKGMKYLWAYGLLCSFAVLHVSQSMAAHCVFLFTFTCAGALWIYHTRSRIFKKLFITTFLLVVFAIGSYLFSEKVRVYIQGFQQRGIRGFFSQRWYAAQDGFHIAKDKPWFGHGITTTPLHYLESKPIHVHHCWQIHVAPVQFWIEFGFLGGLLWGGLLILILWFALKHLRDKSLPKNYKYAMEGCLLAWVAYLMFNSESSWDIFSISGFVCFIGGFLLMPPQISRRKRDLPYSALPLKIVSLAVLGIVVFFSLKDLMGRYYFEKFYNNAVANRFTCEDDLKRALQWDPHQLHYWNQGGYFFASKGFLKNKALAQKAIDYYETSIALNPNQLELLESLGALYAFFGETEQAIEYFCKAILCLPNHTLAYVQLFELLKRIGLEDLYKEWFALSMHICPQNLLRQPDLATEFEHNSDLHRRYFKHFEQLEHDNTSPDSSDAWRLKKYFIKKILFNEKESALLEANAELREANWFNKLISWEKIIKQGWDEPYAKRLYFIPLKQHSNMRILLHAGVGPQLKICTIKEITKPFEFSCYPFECNIPVEKTREILLPLVEKTMKSVK